MSIAAIDQRQQGKIVESGLKFSFNNGSELWKDKCLCCEFQLFDKITFFYFQGNKKRCEIISEVYNSVGRENSQGSTPSNQSMFD